MISCILIKNSRSSYTHNCARVHGRLVRPCHKFMVKIDGENFIMRLSLEDLALCIKRENPSSHKEKASVALHGGLESRCSW